MATRKANTKTKAELDARARNDVGADVNRRDAEQGDLSAALEASRANFAKLTDDEKQCAFVEHRLAMQDSEPDIVRELMSETVCRGVDLHGGMPVCKTAAEAKALIKAVRAANASRFRERDDVDELMADAEAGYREAFKEAKRLRKPGPMITAIDRRLGLRGISVGQGGVQVNVANFPGSGSAGADVSAIPVNQQLDTIVRDHVNNVLAEGEQKALPAGETVEAEVVSEEE